MSPAGTVQTAVKAPDLREKGASRDGSPQVLDQRLFVQLLVFSGCQDLNALIDTLKGAKIEGVLYKDINDPTGVGLLTFSQCPGFFTKELREMLGNPPFNKLTPRPDWSMLGRTYSIGYEQNLEDWLLVKPRRNALNPEFSWAVWYPLRRNGEFSKLPPQEQAAILREHGAIGRSFGEAGYAQDIRLACFGLDQADNDFVIGLVGPKLYPLSAIVQAMRRTKQTSTYIEKMGPFFVGRVAWQSIWEDNS